MLNQGTKKPVSTRFASTWDYTAVPEVMSVEGGRSEAVAVRQTGVFARCGSASCIAANTGCKISLTPLTNPREFDTLPSAALWLRGRSPRMQSSSRAGSLSYITGLLMAAKGQDAQTRMAFQSEALSGVRGGTTCHLTV
jgi:hypothetical protein